MKSYACTLAIAVALGLVGFLTALGLMSVLFATQTDSFAPKNSADAAGWVQAIGSIIAILASYHLGARQAAESQRKDTERHAKQIEKQASIRTLVQSASDRALHPIQIMLNAQGGARVSEILPGAFKLIDETLTTIQKIPMTEVDPPGNMQHIASIISRFVHIKGFMEELQKAIKPPRSTSREDRARSQVEAENARFLFHHRLTYYAAAVHDHLTSLGVPSTYPHPISNQQELGAGHAGVS